MSIIDRHSLAGLVVLTALSGIGSAQADDRLWREQVPVADVRTISLPVHAGAARSPADYLLWREQVRSEATRLYVASTRPAANDYLPWREQVAPGGGLARPVATGK